MLILSVIKNALKLMRVFTQKNIEIAFFIVLLTNLFVLMIDLVSQLLFLKVKMLLINLLKQFLKKTKKHFNKNLIMCGEEEEQVQPMLDL